MSPQEMSSNVIGPLGWTPSERLASWYTMRELRSDIKIMTARDPIKYAGAIDREKSVVDDEFRKYVA